MTSPILFCGSEDISFRVVGPAVTASGTGNITDTTAAHFRSGYARYALAVNGTNGAANSNFFGTQSLGSPSTFWFSARVWMSGTGGASVNNSNPHPIEIRDANNVVRLRLRNTVSNQNANNTPGPYMWEKVNAAGTASQIGLTTAGPFASSPAAPDKIDVFLNYATTGTNLIWYMNGTQVYTFTGDVTTDSTTSVDSIYFGACNSSTGNSSVNAWSEVIVATRDTRAMSLVTQVATAFGNTHNWTNGVVAGINTNIANQVTPDYSQSAGQIEQYQVTPAMPSGSFSVVSVVQHGQAIIGSTGPQHIQFMVRTGGSDFNSATLSPTAAWGCVANNWDTNPATGNAWATTDLVNASVNYNVGYESIA